MGDSVLTAEGSGSGCLAVRHLIQGKTHSRGCTKAGLLVCPTLNVVCGAVDSCHVADAPTCLAGLINPAMPLLIAGAVASAATAGVLGSTVVIPRLKQLPEQSLQLETVRQKLLAQVRGIR